MGKLTRFAHRACPSSAPTVLRAHGIPGSLYSGLGPA